METLESTRPHIIYHVVTGSTAKGVNTEDSDLDEKGVVALPLDRHFSLEDDFGTVAVQGEKDIEMHSLLKFVRLLLKQNPTILEMLWVDEPFILSSNEYGSMLRENRDLFLSKGIFKSFGGYARDQLMRIKGGLNMLTDKDRTQHLAHTLNRMAEHFPDKYTQAGEGRFEIAGVLHTDDGDHKIDLSLRYDRISLSQMRGMLNEMNQTLMTYDKFGNRNKKAEGKLNKHAMHLLWLLKSGIETLQTGKLRVNRADERDFFLKVRSGHYSWSEVFDMVEHYEAELKEAVVRSPLPEEVDRVKAEQLYKTIMMGVAGR